MFHFYFNFLFCSFGCWVVFVFFVREFLCCIYLKIYVIFMRRHNYDRLKNVIKHIGKNLQQKQKKILKTEDENELII